MARGINRATYFNKSVIQEHLSARQTCVFISHQQRDKTHAQKIADYIQDAGIDVYFDENDDDLRLYRETNNPKGVVNSIKAGINKSTHMLCLLSPNTLNSKWVPYEIGYGTEKTHLAVLTLKNVPENEIPDYVKAADHVLRGTKTLNGYLAMITNSLTNLMESNNLIKSHSTSNHVLDLVLDWQL
jgi:hypothetical protein